MLPFQNHGSKRHRIFATIALAILLFVPCASAHPQSVPPSPRAASAALTGHVQDTTGAIIPKARVELLRPSGAAVAATTSDSAGQFRLPLAARGAYRISIKLPGFEPLLKDLVLGDTPPGPLVLTMNLANVATTVDVNANDAVDLASPENNKDAASISANDMKTLPILDGDAVAALSVFLDSGAAGEGGATLIVDGVEMSSLGVSPSAVERVSINQNPYSAQYNQPGRGQVEVITRSTADKYHGELSFAFRDSIFDSKEYFAATKAPTQRRTYDAYLTGPVRWRLLPNLEPLKNTTFLFSFYRQETNYYQQVHANTAPGVLTQQNVFAPFRDTSLSMKVAHQISDHHSAYVLYQFNDSSTSNLSTGGLTLPTAGFTAYVFDMDISFHDDNAFTPNKLNQFNFRFERNIDRTVSDQQAPSIIVQGEFNGGGAQDDNLETEYNPNISDIVSWTVGRNQYKFGVQLPNLGRRALDDLGNRQGTYTFQSLAAYEAPIPAPSTFSIQQGQTHFVTHYDQPGAFVMDQIQATPRLTITPGLRYDFQNTLPGTRNAFQPKLAVAYVLDQKHAMVVRTGGGVYMRRVGVNIGQQYARYHDAAERSLLLTSNVCYPCDPARLAAQPPNLFEYAPNIKAPFQGYFGLSVEREVTKKSMLTVGYEGYRGWHALRSIDINAPLPPFTSSVRPNQNYAQILEQDSGGIQKSDALVVSYRGRIGNVYSGFLQYTYSHADSNTQWSTFFPQNQYDPNAEWSRTNFDQRQRLSLFGTFYPDKPLNLGVGFYDNTPMPYTITTGKDDYHTGLYNARPAGVPRNSLNGGDYQDLQLKIGYTRKLRPHLKDASPTIAFSLSSFNTLNRTSYQDYVGVITSTDFMKPTAANHARRLQLGASYSF